MSEPGFYLNFLHLFKRYLFARWASYRLGLDTQILRMEDCDVGERRLRVDGRWADFTYYFKPQFSSRAYYGTDPQFTVILPESIKKRYKPEVQDDLDLYFWLEFPNTQRSVKGEVVRVREMSAFFRLSYKRLMELVWGDSPLPVARLRDYNNLVLDLHQHAELLELFYGKVPVDFVYIDLETSGLAIEMGAAILEIGVVVGDQSFYSMVRPAEEQWRLAKKSSLQANGITWDVIKNEPTIEQIGPKLATFFQENQITYGRSMIVGQNPHFDRRFLEHYLGPYLIPQRVPLDAVLDVRWLYRTLMNNNLAPVLEKCHGSSIAEALGVEKEPWPHTALAGARQVERNFQELLRQMRLERHV